jgi:hypothetical protein
MQILQEQISVHVGNACFRCRSNRLIPAYIQAIPFFVPFVLLVDSM